MAPSMQSGSGSVNDTEGHRFDAKLRNRRSLVRIQSGALGKVPTNRISMRFVRTPPKSSEYRRNGKPLEHARWDHRATIAREPASAKGLRAFALVSPSRRGPN
jgi:hypothetical protein